MDAMQAILTRRSVRKMKADPVEKEKIEAVVEAGRQAPSGSDSQTTHFIVITNKDILDQLAEIVQHAFANMKIHENMYRSLKNSILASQKGSYKFHYDAPVLIVTANKIGYGNAMADSACAIENMLVAANALDLCSCYINQLHWLDQDPNLHRFMLDLGLQEDETITAAMILGHGARNQTQKNITGNPVTWVA